MNETCRENIFTQFANRINEFVEHTITRENLYDSFVEMVEISDDNERKERKEYLEKVKKLGISLNMDTKIYSNWEEGKNIVRNSLYKK